MAKKIIEDNLGQTLAYRRAIEITDGAMSSIDTDNKAIPIIPYLHGMRTTKAYDTDKEAGQTLNTNATDVDNLSCVEAAKLSMDNKFLKINFSATFLPIYVVPEVADSNEKKKLYIEKNTMLINDDAINKVADYYAYKIINASWGWRNRDSANSVRVEIETNNKEIKKFKFENVINHPLHPILTNIQKELGLKDPIEALDSELKRLSVAIKAAWIGETKPLSLNINGQFEMEYGATVYPSQLFSPETITVGKSEIKKRFYTVPFNNKDIKQVGITSEKINNALRKYDLVSDKDGVQNIISIEPNGSDITSKTAFRGSGKRLIDLYKTLVFGEFSDLTEHDKIFLIGSLVRGGLFQEQSDKKKEPAKKKV